MFHLIEREAELRRNELLRAAERDRKARVFVGQDINIRRPVGRFLVRLGSRLNNEPRREPRLAATGEAG